MRTSSFQLFQRVTNVSVSDTMDSAEAEAAPEVAAAGPEDTAAASDAAAPAPEEDAAQSAAAAPAPKASPPAAATSPPSPPRGYRAGLERSVYHLGELPVRKVPLTATGPPTSSISPPVSKPKRRKPKPKPKPSPAVPHVNPKLGPGLPDRHSSPGPGTYHDGLARGLCATKPSSFSPSVLGRKFHEVRVREG